MNKIECTIGDLYEFNKKTKLVNKGFFKVETQYGFKQIEGVDITFKNSPKYFIKTEKNKILETSPDHLLYSENGWQKVKEFKNDDKIKTRDGYEKINLKLLKDKEDLYDIQVKDVYEFYANDIVSHNSFVINLPQILFYGRLNKFKKDDISNRLNKHGWVKGEIEVNPTTNVTIERNFSPGDLVVYKHNPGVEPIEDDDIGKAGLKNYQDYIDFEVIGLPYHIFSNIISLSINDFKSFISMSPGDKRIIIDKLFAMEILNEMNKLVKEDLRNLKTDLSLFDREIVTLKQNILNASKELEKLKKQIYEDNTTRIKNIKDKMIEYKPKLEEAYNKLQNYLTKEKEIKRSYDVYLNQKSQINSDLKELTKKLKLFSQDKCPTCETPFSSQHFDLIKGDLNNELKRKTEDLRMLLNNEEKYKEAFKKVQEATKKLNDYIIQIKSIYQSLQNELQKLQQDKPKEFSSIENIIANNTIQIQTKEKEKTNLDEDHKYISILEQLYSDDGVKKKILESYLPTLNKEIEYTLSELHFPYRLKFNNDFEPQLEHLGFQINVETLSTGEKKRVDLAVLISIIRMLKRKYPNLNIFMLDEVLSSIDGDGIYDIIGLLQKTAKELLINIFIINHAPLPVEYFDYSINIEKKDGFSNLEITALN